VRASVYLVLTNYTILLVGEGENRLEWCLSIFF